MYVTSIVMRTFLSLFSRLIALVPRSRAGRVREVAVLPAVRKQSGLEYVDYTDAFLIEPGLAADETPEQWARAFFEGAPALLRTMLRRGWASLGLRIGPADSEDRVFGWPVRRSTRDVLLLGAESRHGMPAELLFMRHQNALLFATLIHHQNAGVRARWAGVAPMHRRIVRFMLERASARRAEQRNGSDE